ncbi:MAG: KH domain-containing protein, partial [Anaerolineae bacterium]|nr:KH domain-containing protein [Anaerolineae bacterium]
DTIQIAEAVPDVPVEVPAPMEEAAVEEDTDAVEEESVIDDDDYAEEDELETPFAATDSDSDVANIAKSYLEELLEYMGIEATVTPRIAPDLVDPGEEPPLVLDVTGKDLGILIGRRSETLQALQYMVRLMVSKDMQSWQRIVVDVESYRARRRRSLSQMAKRMAERAVASGERVVMESMSAYDRRIIHVALRDHPDVFTKSIGRESNRKVTIIPK